MIHKQTVFNLATVGLALAMTGAVHADDFAPPEFRGDNLSVQAEWEFNDGGANPSDPSFYNQVPGENNEQVSDDTLRTASMTNMTWSNGPDNDGRWTADANGGNITFDLTNWVDSMSLKQISVQTTFGPDVEGTEDNPFVWQITAVDNEIGTVPQENINYQFTEAYPAPEGLGYLQEMWQIEPNPDYEQIVLSVPEGTFVDQVMIDTVSLPEPASLALFGMGALALMRHRG